jgi:hypothetical protein
MAEKSSESENKVYVMTLTKPSIWPRKSKNGRNHRNQHQSGRGGVAWQHRGLWSLSPEFKSRPRPHPILIVFLYTAKTNLLILLGHFN